MSNPGDEIGPRNRECAQRNMRENKLLSLYTESHKMRSEKMKRDNIG